MAHKDIEARRAYIREWSKRPEVAAKLKAKRSTEEFKAKRRETASAPHRRKAAVDRSRKVRTGVDGVLYRALFALQDGRCAVCGAELVAGKTHTDHDHEENKPRGILCHRCNVAEGMIRGTGLSPDVSAKLLQRYLNHPPFKILELVG